MYFKVYLVCYLSFFIISVLSECVYDGQIYLCSNNSEQINFREIKSLNLSNRGLTELPSDILSKFQFITHLDLSSNLLRGIEDRQPLLQLQQLEYLDLSNNSFIGMNLRIFLKNRNLRVLILNGNPDMLLSPSMAPLRKLEELHLENCGLERLHKSMFEDLTGLVILNLQWNYFKEVPDGLTNVQVIMLKGNPIVSNGSIQDKVVVNAEEYYFGWLIRNELLQVQIGLFLFAGVFYLLYYFYKC